MEQQKETLNRFLVHVFDDILRLEQENLRAVSRRLSLSELHVLESVALCTREGEAGMAEVAALLGVTSGTLTVAVKTLEQKGFLARTRCEKDKRRVHVSLTAQAQPVLEAHAVFHRQMVESVSRVLTPAQLEALADGLCALHGFFTQPTSAFEAPDAHNASGASPAHSASQGHAAQSRRKEKSV